MSPRRILIITNGQLSRNPRPLKEARTLGAAGFDVTVLHVRNHAAGEQQDALLMREAAFRRVCVDLLPGFGTGAATLAWRRAALAFARRRGRSIHALGPARAVLARARALPADLTIVHNEVPHWVGLQLLDAGRRVAADIEDWHSEDLLPADRAARPLAVLQENERTLLHRAAYVSTTSHVLAQALHARYGGRSPEVITNSFPLQPAPVRPAPPAGPVSFFWFSQTLGPGRGLAEFIAGWQRMRQPAQLVLLGEAREDFKQSLLASVGETARSRLVFRPLVSPADLPGVIAGHDVGLALEERAIPSRDLTITNKILQYLNAGLAVVASDTAGQREVLARAPAAGILLPPGAGPETVAAALDDLAGDRAGLQARQLAARRLAEEIYSWEREAPRLIAGVERVLAETR